MQGKVEISGVNTAKLKTLSNEEMMHLIELAQAGDEQAKQKLVEGNLKLVLSVIQRFMGRGENPDDLFQVGCIGLLKAIANFDTSKQVRFSTYGVPMIAGELRRYLRDYSPIRVSRSVRDTAYRVLQCKQELVEKNGREPTMEEIARAMDVPLEEVVGAMDAIASPVSLYEPVYSDGGDPLTVMDQVRDTKNTDERWLGGMLTNFRTMRTRIDRLAQLKKMEEDGTFAMLPKKEVIKHQGEIAKLEKYLGGVKDMKKLPGALFIVDPRKERNAIAEARKLHIPIVAIVDTNCDPDEVDYVIPGNDDAIRAIRLIAATMANAVVEGRQGEENTEAPAAEEAAPAAE